MDRATIHQVIAQLCKAEDKVRTHIEDFYTTQADPEPSPQAGLLVEADEIISDMMSTMIGELNAGSYQVGDE